MRLTSIEYSQIGWSCEQCGHAINWKCTIDFGEGKRQILGRDCAFTLLKQVDGDSTIKRYNRAVSQWKKQEPAPLPEESRENYIVRRLSEMSNARRAWMAWQRRPWIDVNKLLYEAGIPVNERTSDRIHRVRREEEAKMAQRINQALPANSFDWYNKRPWQIEKV